MSKVVGVIKLTLFLLWTALLLPLQMIVYSVHKGQGAYLIPQLYHYGCCKLFGITVNVIGTPVRDRQVMYIANHVSYLDISVMGRYLKASFIAKREVRDWPLFGYLAKLQQSAFIDRSGAEVKKDQHDLGDMLDRGKNLILFPEGTSTDGSHVLPFKSRFFSLIVERKDDIAVQPVTIRFPANGTDQPRNLYAWYGDMEMLPHLWARAQTRGLSVDLVFHEHVNEPGQYDRRNLSSICQETIARGLVSDN